MIARGLITFLSFSLSRLQPIPLLLALKQAMYSVQRRKIGQYRSYYPSPCVHILQYGAVQPPLRQPDCDVWYSGPPYRQRNRQFLGISVSTGLTQHFIEHYYLKAVGCISWVLRGQKQLPYFSIDNAHLMYNAHHKRFTLYFYLSFVITFDLPIIPF